jgi:hypothetical protein
MKVFSVRAASVRDLARIEEIQRHAGGELSETSSRGPVRLWALVSQTLSAILPAFYTESLLYVVEQRGRVVGFIQATNRPAGIGLVGASTLQVLNLAIEPDVPADEAGPVLVQHLANQALQRGIHRLFVRLPLDDALTPIFRQEGFRQYAIEYVLYSEAPHGRGAELPGVRPERKKDTPLLYQLYRKVTPPGVAHVEAPSFKEWRALQGEWFGHASFPGQSEQRFVVDRGDIAAWLRLQASSSTRPHSLSFLAAPEERLAEELVDYALGLLGDSPGAVWSSLRHYDSHMIEALRGRGFATLVTQALLVREQALRVPAKERAREKGFIPAFG